MAKNTRKGYRIGAVKNRSQSYNRVTKLYIKRNALNGRFLGGKQRLYKGVRKES